MRRELRETSKQVKNQESKDQPMKMTFLLTAIFALVAWPTVLQAADAPQTSTKPNIVYLLADDLGWSDIRQDQGEAANVADARPDIVKLLDAKTDAWAHSLGAALTHRPAPAKLDAKPKPEGEVLEITVTVTDQATPSDRLILPFARWDGSQQATDWVEFDIAFARDSLPRGCFYSPVQGNAGKPYQVFFKRGDGIDQFGREQVSGLGPKAGAGAWEHRVIGLCSFAPGPLNQHALVFSGGQAGSYKVYIDNLRIRHADGSLSSLWTHSKDTRYRRIEDSGLFTGVQVRALPIAETGTKDEANGQE